MNNNPWRVISTEVKYQNPWMRVREDVVIRPDGSEGIYGVMESRDSVVIAVLNDRGEVYLIKSFSYPASTWRWGLPGGGGDDEDSEVAARRELVEETGITAKDWTRLGKLRISSGLTTEAMVVYLAQNLSFGGRVNADDADLVIQGKFVSFDQIDQMINDDEIDDCQTITGLYLAQRWLMNH